MNTVKTPHSKRKYSGFTGCKLKTTYRSKNNIGMSIDPDKCDLQHFSWRRGNPNNPPDGNPSLKTSLYEVDITITLPKSIQWLGFHLDHHLTFEHHMNLLAKKGKAITNGLKVLGNTIEGISPSNLRLLYKTVVIPAITYSSQLWFNPKKPNWKLLHKLEQVQHKALIQISGAFWDSPEEALQLLTYVPPICERASCYTLTNRPRECTGSLDVLAGS